MNVLVYVNPFTGEGLPAREWALRLGISKSGFLRRIRLHGGELEHADVWFTAEEARQERARKIALGKRNVEREGEGGNEEYRALSGDERVRVESLKLGSWEIEQLNKREKENDP